MDENRQKILIEEVKIVQDIIKRMAANSFNVKTWAITLVAGTLLLKGSDKHFFIAFIPIVAFWFLDAYYLRQERLFREVHKWVVSHRQNNDDQLFNMDTSRFIGNVDSIFKIVLSASIFPFYGGITLAVFGFLIVSRWQDILKLFECVAKCYMGG